MGQDSDQRNEDKHEAVDSEPEPDQASEDKMMKKKIKITTQPLKNEDQIKKKMMMKCEDQAELQLKRKGRKRMR